VKLAVSAVKLIGICNGNTVAERARNGIYGETVDAIF
jgi:hypothetical protein